MFASYVSVGLYDVVHPSPDPMASPEKKQEARPAVIPPQTFVSQYKHEPAPNIQIRPTATSPARTAVTPMTPRFQRVSTVGPEPVPRRAVRSSTGVPGSATPQSNRSGRDGTRCDPDGHEA